MMPDQATTVTDTTTAMATIIPTIVRFLVFIYEPNRLLPLVGALTIVATIVTDVMCGERREHEASFVEGGGLFHVFSQCQAAEVLAVRYGNIRRVFI
jgi:hypothetical protein